MDLKWIFNCMLSFNKFRNTKSIIRMNQNLMEFILEIICLIIKDGAYVINLYEMQMLKLIGFLCVFQIMMLFILAVLELNTLLSQLKTFFETET